MKGIIFITLLLFIGNIFASVINTPTTLSNIDLDDSDPIIRFEIQSGVTFTGLSLTLSGNCIIESTAPIDIPIFSLSTDEAVINNLSLKNVTLIFANNTNSVYDIVDLVLNLDGNSLVSFVGDYKYQYTFNYNQVPSETIIFSGGKINNTAILSLKSADAFDYIISSAFDNGGSFAAYDLIVLSINPNTYNPKVGSGNYFFGGLKATVKGDIIFETCIFQIGKNLDMLGGKVLLSNAQVFNQDSNQNTLNVNIFNTQLVVDATVVFNFFHVISVPEPLGTYIFRENSNFTLLRGESSLSLKVTGSFYRDPRVQVLFMSDASQITCGNFDNSKNVTSFSDVLLKGYSVCTKRTITTRIFRELFSGPIESPCPDGQYQCFDYVLQASLNVTCVPLGTSCHAEFCPNYNNPLLTEAITMRDTVAPTNNPELGIDLCWDNQCSENGWEGCNPYPPCPAELPLRCSGRCVAETEQCNDNCALRCVENCYNTTDAVDRECQPYNGCGLDQFQCPDKECVTSLDKCSNNTTPLPFTNRFMETIADTDGESGYAGMWLREYNDDSIQCNGDVSITSASSQPLSTITVKPIPDSRATQIDGSSIVSDFNYYTDILLAPFQITVGNYTSIEFIGEPVVFNFNLPKAQNYPKETLCLAFQNITTNKWECTPYGVEFDADNNLIVKTSHFTSFSVLTSYRPPKSDDSSLTSSEAAAAAESAFKSKKNLYIAISVSVVGIVLITVGVGLFVGFKLKYTSLRRWKVSRDLERESSRSRITDSTDSN